VLVNRLKREAAGDLAELGSRALRELRALVLRVEDDGRGIDPAAPEGLGLSSMRSRVRRWGGTFTLGGAPGGGARLTVEVPVDEHRRHRG
jgi:signal transduction histidine kinase